MKTKMKTKCEGCEFEMFECYLWQDRGYDAGLDWGIDKEGEEHCLLFVLDENGKVIVE